MVGHFPKGQVLRQPQQPCPSPCASPDSPFWGPLLSPPTIQEWVEDTYCTASPLRPRSSWVSVVVQQKSSLTLALRSQGWRPVCFTKSWGFRFSKEPNYWHCQLNSSCSGLTDSFIFHSGPHQSVTVNTQLCQSLIGWPPHYIMLTSALLSNLLN